MPQTGAHRHPYSSLGAYLPGGSAGLQLYRSLREAVPIIDAALMKIVRLLGTFEVKTGDDEADRQLRAFLQSVPVGGTRNGIDAFAATFFEQLLTFGTAVGEMTVCEDGITGLYNSDLADVSLSRGENPLDVTVSARRGDGNFFPSGIRTDPQMRSQSRARRGVRNVNT